MAPRAQRTAPPYVQIADHYRERITSGDLVDGDRLPTVAELSREWGVATATASKAITQLRTEGLVRTSPQGTFVNTERNAHAPQDRVRSVRRTGSIYPPTERSKILSAQLVPAPEHVAGALGVDTGAEVLRRERVTYRGSTPVETSVTWMPAEFAAAVPELTSTERIPGGTIGRVAEVLGRHVREGRDTFAAQAADAHLASLLEISEGTPVLRSTNLWCDETGPIEFGESFRAAGQEVGMTYEVQD